MKTVRILAFGVIASIVAIASVLVLFILGVIEGNDATGSLSKALAVIGVLILSMLAIVGVTRLISEK